MPVLLLLRRFGSQLVRRLLKFPAQLVELRCQPGEHAGSNSDLKRGTLLGWNVYKNSKLAILQRKWIWSRNLDVFCGRIAH